MAITAAQCLLFAKDQVIKSSGRNWPTIPYWNANVWNEQVRYQLSLITDEDIITINHNYQGLKDS